MALSGEYAGSNDVAAHGEADEEEEEGEHSWALPDNFDKAAARRLLQSAPLPCPAPPPRPRAPARPLVLPACL